MFGVASALCDYYCYYYYYTVDNALVGQESVTVKRTIVQFSFERPFETFQCTGSGVLERFKCSSVPNAM